MSDLIDKIREAELIDELTYESYKDGIGITKPTWRAELLAELIEADASRTSERGQEQQ